MVEAALGGRFVSEFVDGKEELDVTVQLQNVLLKHRSSCASCRCIAGSN